MTMAKRPLVILSAATFLFMALAVHPEAAEARHRHRHWRVHGAVGAVIVGAVLADIVGAAVDAHIHVPPVSVHVETYPAPPPPPPYYYVPAPPTPPPPPPAPPFVYVQSPPPPHRDFPQLGLALSGTVQSGGNDYEAVGGVAAALQLRTSRKSLLALELQSVGVRRESDDSRRNDLAALLAGRVFFWNAALAPYLELAGGLGRTSLDVGGWHASTSQLLGRIGLGLELRLGRHVVLDGQIASLHRLRVGDGVHRHVASGPLDAPFDEHERATEIRFGGALRF
jgi:hypothetical protein